MQIFNIPFDEPIGTSVAQDFSGNNHDATLEGDLIVPGRTGNALVTFPYTATTVAASGIDYTGDFSLFFWGVCNQIPSNSMSVLAVFVFAGNNDDVLVMDYATDATSWTMFSIVKAGNVLKIYRNEILTDEYTLTQTISGFLIATRYVDTPLYIPGEGMLIDGLEAYNTAISPQEIRDQIFINSTSLQYFINEVDLRSIGVNVEDISGIEDLPAIKNTRGYNWPDRHGNSVDLVEIRYESRKIEINCWCLVTGRDNIVDSVQNIKALLLNRGMSRFRIRAGARILVYDVYFPTQTKFTIPKWTEGRNEIRFTIVMEDPSPVKRILKFTRTGDINKTVTIQMSTGNELFNIYWGDGLAANNVSGTSITQHTYQENKEYYITITGVVSKISNFSANAVTVWDSFI